MPLSTLWGWRRKRKLHQTRMKCERRFWQKFGCGRISLNTNFDRINLSATSHIMVLKQRMKIKSIMIPVSMETSTRTKLYTAVVIATKLLLSA